MVQAVEAAGSSTKLLILSVDAGNTQNRKFQFLRKR